MAICTVRHIRYAIKLRNYADGNSLTNKLLIKAPPMGFAEAAVRTMKVIGHNVIVKDGLVMKKFADGRIIEFQNWKLKITLSFLTKEQQLHPGNFAGLKGIFLKPS